MRNTTLQISRYSEDVDYLPGSVNDNTCGAHRPAQFPDVSGQRTRELADAALAAIYRMMRARAPRRHVRTAA
ncbi:hypothetical protein [Pandoraea norimbergensis]|uniref:Uncharacterized protein n=1 Tax=Pandoraea norimbergensis TaxID=93219 RepID=A0ABM5WMN7_9BURK|nr:hypothetical protein [Pandoraea norimbergensis]ALS61863.1 hypothetical protein AT302_20850 [Pandoraea norimbergensis]